MLEYKVGDKLHGFTVERIRDIDEIEGQLIEMTHDRTGAGLVWVRNGEENKLFSVGFRTLPEDNTGVFHILEHSVLCGSDKYPVKEPFVELIKTSMNTFLNAMTYSDKTLYPVSSRIEQDYLNLMDVYLDAVFCPRILTEPNIFYQEGWHIELPSDDDAGSQPVYKGVVFNEMKGAMSNVDEVAERTMGKLLFPDTCYGFNSGGDPDAIPDLTYEDFIRRYKKFYHPSNSYFYLDGDIPLGKTLERINSYLEKYDRLEREPEHLDVCSDLNNASAADSTSEVSTDRSDAGYAADFVPALRMQEPAVRQDTACYEIGEGEDGKALVMFGRIAGSWEDRDKLLALSVLTEQLADSNESPLKRAALSSGLAEDMEIYVSDGIAQPYLAILFRGVDPDNAEDAAARLAAIVSETTKKVMQDGIPERDLEASINQLDFRFRQYPEPQGLYRANAVFNSWLYDGDPALYLRTGEAIDALRASIKNGTFGRIAEEYLIDTDGFSRLILLPSAEAGRKAAEAEAAKISSIISGMSEEELRGLEDLNYSLQNWQETPDSDEALATIPQLELSEISDEPELIGTEVSNADGVTVLYHPVATNGIVHINAYFPITDLSFDELPAAALLTEFYKDLPTENYSVTELQNEIKMYVGSISFGIDILARDDDRRTCTPVLRARASVLSENLSHAEELLIEIMTRTRFDDKSLMKELITQIDEEGKRYAVSQGHRLAISASRSHYSSRDAAAEAVNGYTFTQYMHDMNGEFDERIDGFVTFARELIARTVVKAGASVSVTASTPQDISGFIVMLADGEARPEASEYISPLPERMGIVVPASVSHSVTAYDLSRMDMRPRGSISVAANILSYAFLWNEIRVKGGAYGTAVSAGRTGGMLSYSYRDPSPSRSLEIYKNEAEFLDELASSWKDDASDLSGFIISTIASTEPLVSPGAKGRMADDFWFSGYTDENRIRIRREILGTTPEDLKSWCEAISNMAEQGCVTVIGPRQAVEACPELEIVTI